MGWRYLLRHHFLCTQKFWHTIWMILEIELLWLADNFKICWCLLSIFLIYCSNEWKKEVNLIYCFQVLFRMNLKHHVFYNENLGKYPSTDNAASRDSLSSQNATWGIVFFSSFYWWHIEYKGWICERLLNLQKIFVSGQNICIKVYGNSVGTFTPYQAASYNGRFFNRWSRLKPQSVTVILFLFYLF